MSPTHHDPDQLAAITRAAARQAGCTCHPDIDVTEEGDGMHRAQVLHDWWCRLMAAHKGGGGHHQSPRRSQAAGSMDLCELSSG